MQQLRLPFSSLSLRDIPLQQAVQFCNEGSVIAAIDRRHRVLDVCRPAQEPFLKHSCWTATRAWEWKPLEW